MGRLTHNRIVCMNLLAIWAYWQESIWAETDCHRIV